MSSFKPPQPKQARTLPMSRQQFMLLMAASNGVGTPATLWATKTIEACIASGWLRQSIRRQFVPAQHGRGKFIATYEITESGRAALGRKLAPPKDQTAKRLNIAQMRVELRSAHAAIDGLVRAIERGEPMREHVVALQEFRTRTTCIG